MGHPPDPKEKVGMRAQCVCQGSRECVKSGACKDTWKIQHEDDYFCGVCKQQHPINQQSRDLQD